MLIPWKRVRSWDCIACGDCCKYFKINIQYEDWVKIIDRHGTWAITPGISEFFIKRRLDGRCVFQYYFLGKWICTLQDIKPGTCKRFPFKIFRKPKYGEGMDALFQYGNEEYYVYLNSFCKGIILGDPNTKFMNKVIPEIIEIFLGRREKQENSTSKLFIPLKKPTIHEFTTRRI